MRAFALVLLLGLPVASARAEPAPRALVEAGLTAMGGAKRLRALHGVKEEAIGHSYLIEQSERPEGPYFANYTQTVTWRDHAAGRVRTQATSRGTDFQDWTPSDTLTTAGAPFRLAGGKAAPGDLHTYEEDLEGLALAPEQVLLTALDAKDLRADGQESAEGLRQDVVRFTWRGRDVRLLLNPYTHLPTLVEVLRAYPEYLFYWVWGDVRTRTSFGNWQLVDGVALPFLRSRSVNGLPAADLTVTKVTLDPADAVWPEIDAGVRAAAEQVVAKGPPSYTFHAQPQELAKGIRLYAGRWNTTLVEVDGGLVVLEAPIASEYGEGVLAEAAATPIAVISTSDAWPHLGGVRPYAARGVPIYVFELTAPLMQRMLDAPHRLAPDAWETRKQKGPKARAELRPVAAKTLVGKGPNRMEIHPLRGEGSERMLMVYFPERKLLYASDLIQPLPGGGFFNPVYLAELVDAVTREKLDVTTVFAVHAGPTPWAKIVEAVAAVRRAP